MGAVNFAIHFLAQPPLFIALLSKDEGAVITITGYYGQGYT